MARMYEEEQGIKGYAIATNMTERLCDARINSVEGQNIFSALGGDLAYVEGRYGISAQAC